MARSSAEWTLSPLGEALKAQFGALFPTARPEPTPEELLDLPATDVIRARAESRRQALTDYDILDDETARETVRRRLEGLALAAEQALAMASRRDQIQASRPAGCWCLGAGGRRNGRDMGIPVPTALVGGDGRPVIEIVEAFDVYCESCPEGQAALDRADDARRRARQWYMAKRVDRAWGSERQAMREYQGLTLETWLAATTDPDGAAKVRLLREWLGTPKWLILRGEYGAGKSGVAHALLDELGERGATTLLVNAPAMMRRVRSSFGTGNAGPDEDELVGCLADVDVLALDDLGADRLSPFGQELVYDLINRRYSEGRRTIVTTNLPLRATSEGVPSLESHVEARTFWRLFERSHPLTLVGNLRQPAARR